MNTLRNSNIMMEQIEAISSYAKQQINKELNLCIYDDGSIIIDIVNGNSFSFCNVDNFYKNIGKYA